MILVFLELSVFHLLILKLVGSIERHACRIIHLVDVLEVVLVSSVGEVVVVLAYAHLHGHHGSFRLRVTRIFIVLLSIARVITFFAV